MLREFSPLFDYRSNHRFTLMKHSNKCYKKKTCAKPTIINIIQDYEINTKKRETQNAHSWKLKSAGQNR